MINQFCFVRQVFNNQAISRYIFQSSWSQKTYKNTNVLQLRIITGQIIVSHAESMSFQPLGLFHPKILWQIIICFPFFIANTLKYNQQFMKTTHEVLPQVFCSATSLFIEIVEIIDEEKIEILVSKKAKGEFKAIIIDKESKDMLNGPKLGIKNSLINEGKQKIGTNTALFQEKKIENQFFFEDNLQNSHTFQADIQSCQKKRVEQSCIKLTFICEKIELNALHIPNLKIFQMADEKKDKKYIPLDEAEINLFKAYGLGPYAESIKKLEEENKEMVQKINKLTGVKELDTGISLPAQWNLAEDSKRATEQPLQVARCNKIINDGTQSKYVIHLKQIAKFVVKLSDKLSPTDIQEGMRVGVDRQKYQIQMPLPAKIDATVTMMTVEDKPDVTYNDIGGCKEQLQKLREVVEMPLLTPEKFIDLGIDPPKGVLLYGPPGTGKTLTARAVANRTDACFIRVIGSELVQKYVGEGARMVREIFQMARTKKACIIFFDEVDAIGGARFDDGSGGDHEVQRTMLQIVNQMDGFESRGNIKVLMATNRPDTLDPALMRPGRIDRKIEFSLPDLQGRVHIFKIHAKTMSVEKGIRYELLGRLCPNTTGAELRSVCTEAGMFAIRDRRKAITEKDLIQAIDKVIKGYKKFSATGKYMVYN